MANRIVQIALLAVTLLASPAGAALPGDVDPTYGDAGQARLSLGPIPGVLNGGALMPDGRVLVVGEAGLGDGTSSMIARFDQDGNGDTTLGGVGFGFMSVDPDEYDAARAAVVQPDGKMVIVGNYGDGVGPAGFYVVRLLVDGTPDADFGESGAVIVRDDRDIDTPRAVLLQPDGKIVVAGDDVPGFGIMRFEPDGTPDPTFGDDGRVQTRIGDKRSLLGGIVLLADGGLLAVGEYDIDFDITNDEWAGLAAVRYDSKGALVPSYGDGGIATVHVPDANILIDEIALQSDGRLVVAGETVGNDDGAFYTEQLLLRLLPDGSLDPTFADGGLYTNFHLEGYGGFSNMAVLPDDSIVVGSFRDSFRFTPDGSLDTTYGAAGVATRDMRIDEIIALPNGRVLFLGNRNGEGPSEWRLERVLVDLVVAPPRGQLGNPEHDSDQSGVGVFSGWTCADGKITVVVDDLWFLEAGSGTSRGDTEDVCGDTDNGFAYLINWPLLGEGEHEAVVYVDGLVLDRATFRVTSLGANFIRGATSEVQVSDFPTDGNDITLAWEESTQSFRITDSRDEAERDFLPEEIAQAAFVPSAHFENPRHGSYQSGVTLMSGWICDADDVTIVVDDEHFFTTASGTSRGDTLEVCGDTNNGYSFLVNMNLFGDGEHEAVVYADGERIDSATFYVKTLGERFLRGVEGQVQVADFEGMDLTLEWSQPLQNFVVVDAQ